MPGTWKGPMMGWMIRSRKYVRVLIPGNCYLIWKGVFEDVIKDLKMKRSSWIIQVGPESNDKCTSKRHMGLLDRKEGHVRVETGCQGMPTVSGCWNKQDKKPSLEHSFANTLISDFRLCKCEKINFCRVKPLCLWSSVMATTGNT